MTNDAHIIETDKLKLLKLLSKMTTPTSKDYQYSKTALLVYCSRDIEKTMSDLKQSVDSSTSSRDKLSIKLFWLNIIIALATITGVIFGVLKYVYQCP